MRLTRASSYAIHALVHIASHKPANTTVASHEIARARNIPERFLLKVLKPLVAAGLLTSVKGPNGGYRLAKPAAQITMLEILEAVEGPIRGQLTFQSDEGGPRLNHQLETLCTQVAQQMRKQLQGLRLSQIATS